MDVPVNLNELQIFPFRFSLAALPPCKGALINAKLLGKIPLADAEFLSMIHQPLRHSVAPFKRIVAQEFDHAAHVIDARFGAAPLPIPDSRLVAADNFRYVFLHQPQIEPPLSDHLADGFWICRIALHQSKVWPL